MASRTLGPPSLRFLRAPSWLPPQPVTTTGARGLIASAGVLQDAYPGHIPGVHRTPSSRGGILSLPWRSPTGASAHRLALERQGLLPDRLPAPALDAPRCADSAAKQTGHTRSRPAELRPPSADDLQRFGSPSPETCASRPDGSSYHNCIAASAYCEGPRRFTNS